MRVTEHIRGEAAVLNVNGNLYTPGAGDHLERTVDRLAREGLRLIVADLQHVSAMDAGGLGSIVAAYRACVRSLGRFRLVHVPWHVRHMIDITGLTAVLEMFDSLDAALANPPPVERVEGVSWGERQLRPSGRSAGHGAGQLSLA